MKTSIKRKELIKRAEDTIKVRVGRVSPEEIIKQIEARQTDRQNNLILGIAIGVMIVLCAVIYVGVSYLEAVMY